MKSQRKLTDYLLEDGVLRIIPLEKQEVKPMKDWINKYNSSDKWDIINIEGIEFIEIAGSGANGIVVKGRQVSINRLCGIKFWMPHHKNAKYYNVSNTQYKEEVKKLGTFSNSRIVSIHDAKETIESLHPYSIMEWIDGITLEEWYKRNQHESIIVRYEVFTKIIETVHYCHSRNIYHGDLHDKNIMITGQYSKEYDIKLLDFGTSLFSREYNPEKTKQRESKFLFEILLLLIPETQKHNFTTLTHRRNINEGYINVEDCKPELVLLTIGSIAKIVYILEIGSSTTEALADIAEAISSAPYLNVIALIECVVEFITDSMSPDKDVLIKYFVGCLENYFEDKLQELGKLYSNPSLVMLYVTHKSLLDMNIKWLEFIDEFGLHERSKQALIDLYSSKDVLDWIESVLVETNSYRHVYNMIEMSRAYLYQYARKKIKYMNGVELVLRFTIIVNLIELEFDALTTDVIEEYAERLDSLDGHYSESSIFDKDHLNVLNMKI